MSYACCQVCEYMLDKPTAREVLDDHWVCRQCGITQDITEDEHHVMLEDILDRLETLEATKDQSKAQRDRDELAAFIDDRTGDTVTEIAEAIIAAGWKKSP